MGECTMSGSQQTYCFSCLISSIACLAYLTLCVGVDRFTFFMVSMEDDRMEIQLLMTGPANEANLYEILVGGTLWFFCCLSCCVLVQFNWHESNEDVSITGTFDHNTHQVRLPFRYIWSYPWDISEIIWKFLLLHCFRGREKLLEVINAIAWEAIIMQ